MIHRALKRYRHKVNCGDCRKMHREIFRLDGSTQVVEALERKMEEINAKLIARYGA